jgi:hypothetical protein
LLTQENKWVWHVCAKKAWDIKSRKVPISIIDHCLQTLNLHCIWKFSVWKQWSMIIQTTIVGVGHLPTFTHHTPSFHSHLWFSTHL